jgi:very-short-patch-repair endonuclease
MKRTPIDRLSNSAIQAIAFMQMLKNARLAEPLMEYYFHPERQWRFDFAWPERKVALEVDGGIWTQGRHTRGKGWLNDTEKLNAAASMGWRMLRCTPQQLATEEMVSTVKETLNYPVAA